jgi:hypothetical protein
MSNSRSTTTVVNVPRKLPLNFTFIMTGLTNSPVRNGNTLLAKKETGIVPSVCVKERRDNGFIIIFQRKTRKTIPSTTSSNAITPTACLHLQRLSICETSSVVQQTINRT